jgi:hypothetical protein
MGAGLGHEVAMDFAYDSDSLYFFCRAADNAQQAEGSNVDGVRLYVETAGAVAVRPMKTSYNYYCELNGNVSRFSGGDRGGWDSSISNGAHLAVKRYIGYYIMELAIPWEDMQLAGPPSNDMRVNIVLYDATAEGIATETIPDAKAQKTWTWMPLQLKVPTGIRTTTVGDEARITLRNSCLDIECRESVDEVAVYAIDGRLMARRKLTGNRLSMPLNTVEPCVVNLQLISGIRITRKIMPEGK